MGSSPVFTASGLASGLPVNDIIASLIDVERQPITLMENRLTELNYNNASYQNVEGRAQTLLGTITSILAESVLDENPFQIKSATTSIDGIASVSVDETAAVQNITLEVQQLATTTSAKSQSPLGATLTGTSLISDVSQGSVTDGDFAMFIDGTEYTITVDNTQDVDSVLSQISAIPQVSSATVIGGQLSIDYTSGTSVFVGSHNDSTNFAKVTQLTTGTKTATNLTSAFPMTSLNLGEIASSAAANLTTPLTDGTFTINGEEFDTTGKTLSEIVTDINNNGNVGVSAAVSLVNNQLELTAKDTGNELIQLQDGTSNFLAATGLLVGGDPTISQTEGQNATFVLNGALLYSNDNSVDESITGLTGVTLDLESTNTGGSIDITVNRDFTKVEEGMTEFVANINNLFDLIDSQTDPQGDGALKGENGIIRFKSSLRTQISDGVSGLTEFNNMASVGVSTGAVSGSGTASTSFVFDSNALQEALASNPSEVEALMTGSNGILTELKTLIDAAVLDDPDPINDGLFAAHDNSVSDQIEAINDRIARAEERLVTRENLLRRQFTAMENVFSQMQSQGAALTNLSTQLGANN